MNVRLTRRAQVDLEGILNYLERRSPESARIVAANLRQTLEVVANHPRSGTSTRQSQVLVKIVPNYPYKIFYRLEKDFIDMLHIRHSARRP